MREQQEMRAVYCATMMEMAEKDERIVAVQADLMGGHGMKPFAAKFPGRSFNVGVAEANMAGIAAGLAAAGKIPFIHSFATFATRRCFDQIAISICYAGLNVRIIGSDPGVSAELNGATHMPLEDVGIMRVLPGLSIFEPVDSVQLRAALPALTYQEGPVYIRLSRKTAESVFQEGYSFRPGRADVLKEGTDVTIIAAGLCVSEALAAAGRLDAAGIKARVLNIHTVKPIDTEAVIRAAAETGAVVTAENHSIIGGLGSAVAEVLAEEHPAPLVRVGVRDRFGEVGKLDYLMRAFGITAADIESAALKAIGRKL
ncbi:MAG: transketolase family protein [Deltaproteobacteria bacterium]|jgi:transketolase|nr:transketolase family protein [Deltaproteobacteria bacterium]